MFREVNVATSTFPRDIYAVKAQARRDLAKLPIEEKIRRLVQIQERARVIAIGRGREPPLVWKLPSRS
jgi:hypothetical protein